MRFKLVSAVIALLIALVVWQAQAQPPDCAPDPRGYVIFGGQQPVPQPIIGQRGQDSSIAHGEYLVTRVAMCVGCHTPKTADGKPDHSRHLQGAVLPIAPKEANQNWADKSPDITASGLAGKLSVDEITRFLMTGIDPAGKKARHPMPAFRMNQRDAHAVAVYLKSVKGANGSATTSSQGVRYSK